MNIARFLSATIGGVKFGTGFFSVEMKCREGNNWYKSVVIVKTRDESKVSAAALEATAMYVDAPEEFFVSKITPISDRRAWDIEV